MGSTRRTGKPRWRRFVGYDTDFVPQIVGKPAGRGESESMPCSNRLCSSTQRASCAGGSRSTTGQPRPLRLSASRVLVGGRSGKLRFIDLETGRLSGFVQIPQPLRVPPVVEPRERLYYQVAEQANLYVLAAEGGECREVFYLGHEPESIAAPRCLLSVI